MIKKTFLLILTVGLLGLYFILKPNQPGNSLKKNTTLLGMHRIDSGSAKTLDKKSGEGFLQNKSQSSPILGEKVINQKDSVSSTSSVTSVDVPKMNWADGFNIILKGNVIESGLPTEASDCLQNNFKENFKLEKPLSFEQMSDKCSIRLGFSSENAKNLYSAFEKSIKDSRRNVSLDAWYSCALKRKIKNGTACINEIFKISTDQFYKQNIGNNSMNGVEFINSWSEEVDSAIEKTLHDCPDDLNTINELYAYECTAP